MRSKTIGLAIGLLLSVLIFSSVFAQERIYRDVIQKIKAEAYYNSQIMENASTIADVFGPRLAHSPSYLACAKWVKEKFQEYGLSQAKLDPYGKFGVTWSNEFTSVHMMTPFYMPVIAYPNTWCRGTPGKIRGNVIYINFREIAREADLAVYKDKLQDVIIFTEEKQELRPNFEPLARRFTDDELKELEKDEIGRERDRRRSRERLPWDQIVDFVFAEGAAVIVIPDGRENYGTVMVNEVPGKAWEDLSSIHPPFLVMAAEHYNRIMRIIEKGKKVEMEVDLKISISNENRTDYNERRAYHTNMDTYDRLLEEDLIQAAVVMASFVYHAAMQDELIPRNAPMSVRLRGGR